MAVQVTEADLTGHREFLIATVYRLLTAQSDGHRFDWLYKNGPYGEARAWLAIDGDREAVVGVAAAFPRRFFAGDREISGWVLGDFCLDPGYRSLGPALQLQRACLGVMGSTDGMLCYDFPSSSMLAVYKRLGIAVTEKMLRFAKLLRVDRKMREVIGFPVVARPVVAVANALIKVMPKRVVADRSLEVVSHQGACGEEFSILAREHRGRLGICLQRSAEYLNWRYVNNPLADYEFITARRRGKLKGYAVWTQAGEDASVADLFGENDPATVKALLGEVIARLINRGVMTLSVWLNESHPWRSWYSEMRFRVRDSAPLATIAKGGDLKASRWCLMQGDRDS
jgi:hypothetical protein